MKLLKGIKYLLFLLFIITFRCISFSANDYDIPLKKFSYSFIFFSDLTNCSSCDLTRYNDVLSNIKKSYPNSEIRVYVKVVDISQFHPLVAKQYHCDSVLPDVGGAIYNLFNMSTLPSFVVLNYNGDLLYKFESKDFSSDLSMIEARQSIVEIPDKNILLDTNGYYQVGSPLIQSCYIRNDKLYISDILKNSFNIYDINLGNHIFEYKPDSKLENYFLTDFSEEDIERYKSMKQKVSSCKSLLPLKDDIIIGLFSNLSHVTIDTVFIKNPDTYKDDVPKTCKLFGSTTIGTVIKDGKLEDIFQYDLDNYSINYPKYASDTMYFANISWKKDYKNIKEDDEIFTFISSKDYKFSNPEYHLSNQQIMKATGRDSFNLKTSGLLVYSNTDKSIFYINPWNDLFIKYFPENHKIVLLEARGILKGLFKDEADSLSNKFSKNSSGSIYYLMEGLIIDDMLYVLFMHRNSEKFSDHFVLQKYNLEGEFVKEIIFFDESDKIFNFRLLYSFSNELKILIQSSKRRWSVIDILGCIQK